MDAGGEKSGDFYAVLGLKKECSEAELRNAYKKLALRWHPDRCSASGNSKTLEEAKEKFQEIQAAYSVLSDSNKRFLYDFGIYESDDEENGMGDFLGEMAKMMSQTKSSGTFVNVYLFVMDAMWAVGWQENGHESLEELQQLFVDMFQVDLNMDLNGGPPSPQKATGGWDRFSSPSSSSTSASPPRCSNNMSNGSGNYKRGSASINSPGHGKAKLNELDPCATAFCFGSNDARGSARGSGGSSRRSGRKQKLSSKHDVTS